MTEKIKQERKNDKRSEYNYTYDDWLYRLVIGFAGLASIIISLIMVVASAAGLIALIKFVIR